MKYKDMLRETENIQKALDEGKTPKFNLYPPKTDTSSQPRESTSLKLPAPKDPAA